MVSLLLDQQHFAINTEALESRLYAVYFLRGRGSRAQLSDFLPRRQNHLMLALVMVGSAMVIAIGIGKLFHWDIGLTTAGMLAA